MDAITERKIPDQLTLFHDNLPRKPYCSDDLENGLIIRSAATAEHYRYIQPNHPNSKLWLMYDIDRPTGPEELTDDFLLPAPTLWVQNRNNNHAHALYALETPVHLNEQSSKKAMRFYGAVDVAMAQATKADMGYVGLVCKNPLNSHWRTYSMGGQYELNDLAECLDLKPYQDKRKNLPDFGLGRNCTLFDRLRTWAYRAIRQGWPDYDRWFMAVEQRAGAYNDFKTPKGKPNPLPLNEVRHIAKSVAKWTHRNMTESSFELFVQNTHTSEIQAVRGKKGAEATAKIKRDKREQDILNAIEEIKSTGKKVTQAAVCKLTGCHRNTLNRYYSDLFKKVNT